MSLSTLPADSPLRQATEAYLTRADFPGTLEGAVTENTPQDIQETIRTASRFLALGEKGTAPHNGNTENHLQWIFRRHLSDVVQAENDTHTEPLDVDDIVDLMRRGRTDSRALAVMQFEAGQLEKETTPRNPLVALARNGLRTMMGDREDQERTEREEILAKAPAMGHVIFEIRKDSIAILTLGVKAEARGTGITETLLTRVMSDQMRTDGHPLPLIDARQEILSPAVRRVADLLFLLSKVNNAETPAQRAKWLTRLQRARFSDFRSNACHVQLHRMIQPILEGDMAFLASENGQRCLDAVLETLETLVRVTSDLSVLDHPGNTGKQEKEKHEIALGNMSPDEKHLLSHFVPTIDDMPCANIDASEIWIKASVNGDTIGVAAYGPMTQDDDRALVASINGDTIRVAASKPMMQDDDDRALILRRFFVVPKFWKQGAASELAAALLRELPPTGSARLRLPESIPGEKAKAEAASAWRANNKPH